MNTEELLIQRHKKYFNLTLGLLPAHIQKEDSNKLLLVYCSLGGLSLLGYEFRDTERTDYIDFIYSHLVSTGEGFRGSSTHQLPEKSVGYRYDPPTIANTYSALCCLAMLSDKFWLRLNKQKIMNWVVRCQRPDGSFASLLDLDGKPYGDGDLRQCYMALAIRRMLRYQDDANDIDLDNCESYIRASAVYDGGLGSYESHAGYTFCGLAALNLIGRIVPDEWEQTIDWLAHRQIGYSEYNRELLEYEFCDANDQGGHNGRDNKFGDTCYSFWVTGSLSLLGRESIVDAPQLTNYLLGMTQNTIVGGFAKTEEDNPDPYHSFLALCALSLIGHPNLKQLDPTLVISKSATNFIDS